LTPISTVSKEAFYGVSKAVEDFGAAGQEHGLNLACAFTFFRQLRDDAAATLDHANTQIGQIAHSLGTTRDALEARESHLARNKEFLEKVEGHVDPADLAIMRHLLMGDRPGSTPE
jgi:hypothetical protein